MASEIKVDTIVNAGGDNDTGIDLGTNDAVKIKIANAVKAEVDSSGHVKVNPSVIISPCIDDCIYFNFTCHYAKSPCAETVK